MGVELVINSISSPEEPKTLKQIFDELCPHYMLYGLSYEDFWYGSTDKLRAYRKYVELKLKRENELQWRLGAYVYNAICDASPLFIELAPKGTTAYPYLEEPFPITEKEIKERERKKQEQFHRGLFAYLMSP